MNTLKGAKPSAERLSDFPKDEEITRPEGVSIETAWGRLASIFADLDPRESHEAASLLLNWTKAGPEPRVLISALARLLKDK
jgi:hypothetical protein